MEVENYSDIYIPKAILSSPAQPAKSSLHLGVSAPAGGVTVTSSTGEERQADVKTLLKAFMSFSALEKLDCGPALSPDIHFLKSETSGELLCSPFNPGCLGKGIEAQSWTQMCGVTFAQVGKWVRGSTRTLGGQTHTGAEEANMCTGPWRGSSTPRSVLLVSSPLPTRSQAQRLTMSQGWVP